MGGDAAWEMLTGKGRCFLQVTLCDPYLNALEAFANTRYIDVNFTSTFLYSLQKSSQSASRYDSNDNDNGSYLCILTSPTRH